MSRSRPFYRKRRRPSSPHDLPSARFQRWRPCVLCHEPHPYSGEALCPACAWSPLPGSELAFSNL